MLICVAHFALLTAWAEPARTMRIEEDQWENRSWGFHDIRRTVNLCDVAISSQGSRRSTCETRGYRNYLIPESNTPWRSDMIDLANPQERILLDHKTREAWRYADLGGWSVHVLAPEDAASGTCHRTAAIRGAPDFVGTNKFLGFPVARYSNNSIADGIRIQKIELLLAPGLSCEVMESTFTYLGSWGLPAARTRTRIIEYQAGEPPANKFTLPPGYRIIDAGSANR